MEPKYKLKKEVRHLFSEGMQKEIMDIHKWNKEFVSLPILEEVPRVYVEYGHETGPLCRDLRRWGKNQGSFYFTVVVDDLDNKEYDSIRVPEMMDEIQKVLNKYFRY